MRTHRINTERRFGEAACYVYVVIDGKPAMLTEEQVRIGHQRAKRHPEDLPRRTWWQRLLGR